MAVKFKGDAPTIFITPFAKQKLDLYIKCCKQEISGFGTVEKIDRDFLITDVFIFEQRCTQASSDIDSADVAAFLTEAVMRGVNPSNIKLFWHSHAGGGVFWSGIDDESIDGLSGSWMISLVGNHKGDYKVRLDIYDFVRFTIDDLTFMTKDEPNEELRAAIEEEIKAKVKYGGIHKKAAKWPKNILWDRAEDVEDEEAVDKYWSEDEDSKDGAVVKGDRIVGFKPTRYWSDGC